MHQGDRVCDTVPLHYRMGRRRCLPEQCCPCYICRLALSPGAKSLVFAMGKGGIQRLDLDARGKTPKFTEITGSPGTHQPACLTH